MMARRWASWTGVVAGAWLLAGSAAQALPVIVEAGWSLVRTDYADNATSAHYNPVDGHLYVASLKRASDGGGIFRIETDGSLTRIADADRPRGVVIDPVSGDVFHSEAGAIGAIYRTAFGTTGRQLWVHGFHYGDDDPIGMAIAPLDYTGNVVDPGAALVVDEGNGGPAEVWAWTPFAIDCSVSGITGCRNEYAAHSDDGSLLAPTDITIGRDGVYLVDWGQIFELLDDGTVLAIPTLEPRLALRHRGGPDHRRSLRHGDGRPRPHRARGPPDRRDEHRDRGLHLQRRDHGHHGPRREPGRPVPVRHRAAHRHDLHLRDGRGRRRARAGHGCPARRGPGRAGPTAPPRLRRAPGADPARP